MIDFANNILVSTFLICAALLIAGITTLGLLFIAIQIKEFIDLWRD